jgi:hypothetical protein
MQILKIGKNERKRKRKKERKIIGETWFPGLTLKTLLH